MAGSSLLALIDDIATLLDDIAVMTKVAAKKTAGVVSDDLAVNAEQVSGIAAERELPVVWAVAKGSTINKMILVPIALIISAIAPKIILPLLMLGGAFLCFEGFEKVLHTLKPNRHTTDKASALSAAISQPKIDWVEFEKSKVKGAIRTDFILSAEIIIIALGTMQDAPLPQQAIVISIIALAMTFGVYSLVAAIVKLDDLGLYLINHAAEEDRFTKAIGSGILGFAPYLMKLLSVVGTVAMFIVGGSILLHGIPGTETLLQQWIESMIHLPWIGHLSGTLLPILVETLLGFSSGAVVFGLVQLLHRFKSHAH